MTNKDKEFIFLEFSVLDNDIKEKAKSIADHVPTEEVLRRMENIQMLRTLKSIELMLAKFNDANNNARDSGKRNDVSKMKHSFRKSVAR
jgi:hypothetical protein